MIEETDIRKKEERGRKRGKRRGHVREERKRGKKRGKERGRKVVKERKKERKKARTCSWIKKGQRPVQQSFFLWADESSCRRTFRSQNLSVLSTSLHTRCSGVPKNSIKKEQECGSHSIQSNPIPLIEPGLAQQ